VTARFASNLLVLVIGAFLAPARFIFEAGTVRWIAFGAGAAVTVVIAAAFLVRGRGPVQRALDVVLALVAIWTAVSALTLSPTVVGWLALGEGGALPVLALAGLVAHEVLMERPFRVAERHVAQDGVAFTPTPRRAQVPVASSRN
jgi:hypothetical protein